MAKEVDAETWYIHVDGEPKGPLSIRDIDVLIRTNEITSKTLGWKAGMKEWKPLIDIDEIKDSIQESSKQIIEITQKKTTMFDQKKSKFAPKTEQKPPEEPLLDEDPENPQEEDPMVVIAATVENLVKNSFHQSEDGKWNIYNEEKKEWFTQVEEPKEQIEAMKNALLAKLKTELFVSYDVTQSNKKEPKRRRQGQNNEPQEVLTKEELQKRERNRKKTKRAAEKKKQKWYNPKINTFVYINGLPPDITEGELKEFASRAGVIRMDHQTGREKIKIYRNQDGTPKGDAAISYTKEESIGIALEMLNERQIKPGFVVKIERAQFNQKNEQYKARQSKKVTKVNKILAKKNEQKLLAWNEEDITDGLKIVILKNMFTLEQIGNEELIAETKLDIQSECEKIGPIQRIRFFQTHPQGVVEVKFKQEADAQKCIELMHGRFFDGRQIECNYWDGQTNYKNSAGTQMIENSRIDEFGNWLQAQLKPGEQPRKQIKVTELSLADLQQTAPILPNLPLLPNQTAPIASAPAEPSQSVPSEPAPISQQNQQR